MYYLGITLLVWLALGFLTAIKRLTIDRKAHIASVANLRKHTKHSEFMFLFENTKVFIAFITLLGGFSFVADLAGTLKAPFKKKGGKQNDIS